MPVEMHIASAIVYTPPGHVDSVAARVREHPPIQLHGSSPSGKLVVTLEGQSSGDILDQVAALQQLDHVLNVALVFQSIEPEEDTAHAVQP